MPLWQLYGYTYTGYTRDCQLANTCKYVYFQVTRVGWRWSRVPQEAFVRRIQVVLMRRPTGLLRRSEVLEMWGTNGNDLSGLNPGQHETA